MLMETIWNFEFNLKYNGIVGSVIEIIKPV